MSNKLDLIFEYENSPEELANKYWKCNYINTQNSMLHYYLIIPNEVQPNIIQPKAISDNGILNIGVYTGKIPKKGYLEIHFYSQLVNYEIDPYKWLVSLIKRNDEQIITEKIYTTPIGIFGDVLCSKKENNGINSIARYTVQKNYDKSNIGTHYTTCKVACKENDYELLKHDFFQITSSWGFINSTNKYFTENLNIFRSEVLDNVNFVFPASWELKKAADNNHIISRYVFSQEIENNVFGVINLFCLQKPKKKAINHHGLVEGYTEKYKEIENVTLELEKPIKIEKTFSKGVDNLWQTQGKISNTDNKKYQKISIYTFSYGEKWFYFELVGTHPDEEFLLSAIHDRALTIMIDSFNNTNFLGENYEMINKNIENNYQDPLDTNNEKLKFKLN